MATYAQAARMAGNGKMSRAVGNALHKNPAPGIIPCHRVVDAQGRLADSFAFGGKSAQAELLEKEGVVVVDGRVDLKKFQRRNEMAIIKIECPACGATPEMDENNEFGYCMYCGTKIYIPNAIQRIKGVVSIDRDSEINNLLSRAEAYEKSGEYEKANEYFDRVLDMDSNNRFAKKGLSRTQTFLEPNLFISRTFDTNRNPLLVSVFENQSEVMLITDLYRNQEKVKSINDLFSGKTKAVKLPPGHYYIHVYMGNFNKSSDLIAINIETMSTRINIDCTVKLTKTMTEVSVTEKELDYDK